MTKRIDVMPAPAPLEEYAEHFDPFFGKSTQREGFRRYVEGLLLPTERHKTLTGLTNTEPLVGAQAPRTQKLQWFLSESDCDEHKIQTERLRLLRDDASTAPNAHGVLGIDETGDRKDGHKTAPVGRQYLGNLGTIDNGVVSVTSLWADEQVYYPWETEPYTPESSFAKGRNEAGFRTKLKIALQLVEQAVAEGWPCRAVVAETFYGEDRGLKSGLQKLGVPYVMGLKPSHAWYHPEEGTGTLQDVAHEAGWQSAEQPGQWVRITRTFRDGSTQEWWALEIIAGPSGPDKAQRALVASTDPLTVPDATTWYLVTNLPAPSQNPQREASVAPASLEEVLRLYGLRLWVEQSYKQVKHALGWSQYQVRSDQAIRRHWQLVCCAFSFCWYHASHAAASPAQPSEQGAVLPADGAASSGAPGDKNQRRKRNSTAGVLAEGTAGGTRMVGALDHAQTLLAWVVATAPTFCVAMPALLA
jgi:DDE superfamily endonuclease